MKIRLVAGVLVFVLGFSGCGTSEVSEVIATLETTNTTASSYSTPVTTVAIETEKLPEAEKYVPAVFSENIDITDKIPNEVMRSEVRSSAGIAANAPIMSDDAAKVIEIDVSGCDLTELVGLEYFHNLKSLNCSNNNLKTLPPLPDTLTKLICLNNKLTNLPYLPDTITFLNVSENRLTYIPNLPKSLKHLYCNDNKLTSLPEIHDYLSLLICNKNRLTSLPKLPETIMKVVCNDNNITSLPNLPENMTYFECKNNEITSLPTLHRTLYTFSCVGNPIKYASAYTRGDEYKQRIVAQIRREQSTNTTSAPKPTPTPATPPEPTPTPIPFPVIDGSTSTITLDVYIKSQVLGISTQAASYDTIHNKTFEAFENLVNGEADIVLSVPLAKEQEAYAADKDFDYEAVPVALEGFVFLVNPKNPVQSLTQEQIRKIYSGEITNWKELGGNDAPIEAYQRNGNSGSQTFMTSFMGEMPLVKAPETLVSGEMGTIISMFENYDNSINAIGYSVYSYAAAFAANEGTFNFVEVDGIKPSRNTFIDGSYPLLSQTYAFYQKDTTDPLVKDYIELITSEKGQMYVLEAGYIPVMDIEIPTAYTLYEAKGTGEAAPENINYDYYYLNFNADYKYDTRPRGFLKDVEFEAEIQAWIDEAEDYYDYMYKSKAEIMGLNFGYSAVIKNGYLEIIVGDRYWGSVWDFEELYGKSAVFDIVNKKKIDNLSDMFYKDADFMPSINKDISAAILDVYYGGALEFFGLCSDFTFDLSSISLLPDNAYLTYPASFDLNLSDRADSVVSHCRDFRDYITPEFADRIKFVEVKNSENYYEKYYEKNDHLYSYLEYRGVENSRELSENKLIEEMYDKYYADGGYDSGGQSITKFGTFIRLSTGFESPTYYYSLAERKFIDIEDLFNDGFEEHLEINLDRDNSKESPYDIYQNAFNLGESYENENTRNLALYEIVKQLSDEHKDNYIVITVMYRIDLRIDVVWLKDIYQNIPTE
jgi:phosphate transport system substrate-binding protein